MKTKRFPLLFPTIGVLLALFCASRVFNHFSAWLGLVIVATALALYAVSIKNQIKNEEE